MPAMSLSFSRLKCVPEPMMMNPAQFDAFIRREHDELGKVLRDAGTKPQ